MAKIDLISLQACCELKKSQLSDAKWRRIDDWENGLGTTQTLKKRYGI
jgi:hypothetical protein